MVGFMNTRGLWQLQIGTYQQLNKRHLPSGSAEIEPHTAIAVDLRQTWWEFTVGAAFCAPGNLWDRSLDSWMFLGTDFIISILASTHITRSTKSLHGDIRSSWSTRSLLKNECFMVLKCPFTKTLYIVCPPLPLWSSLSELSETLPPGLQSSFCPR